jgi:hypothetical protein
MFLHLLPAGYGPHAQQCQPGVLAAAQRQPSRATAWFREQRRPPISPLHQQHRHLSCCAQHWAGGWRRRRRRQQHGRGGPSHVWGWERRAGKGAQRGSSRAGALLQPQPLDQVGTAAPAAAVPGCSLLQPVHTSPNCAMTDCHVPPGTAHLARHLNSLETLPFYLPPPPECMVTAVCCQRCRPRDPSSTFSWPTPLVARSLSAEDMEMEVQVLPAVTPEQYPTPDPRQLSPEGGPAAAAAAGSSHAGHEAAAAGEESVACACVAAQCQLASKCLACVAATAAFPPAPILHALRRVISVHAQCLQITAHGWCWCPLPQATMHPHLVAA